MAHPEAVAIWKELWKQKREGVEHPMICDIGEKLGIEANRVSRIAQKWCDMGLLNCGISARTGWTEVGITEESLK